MDVAMLLRKIVAKRKGDLDLTWSYSGQLGAQQAHHPLTGKALANTSLEIRIARLKCPSVHW
jgi:hypothetical protein